jgi:hypothetical protein
MPFDEMRAIDRSCPSYRPGHQVHWIQAKKAVEEDQPVIHVAIVVQDDGRVGIQGDNLNLTVWKHDPQRLPPHGPFDSWRVHDPTGDPAAVEAAGLRNDLLAVDVPSPLVGFSVPLADGA